MKNRIRLWAAAMAVVMFGSICGMGEKVQASSIFVGKDLVEGLNRAPDYCILENSSREFLSEDTIQALSNTEKQMAVNEIYARRGRKFLLKEVQDYFNEKNWYQGTTEAQDFDEHVFNQYESSNVAKLSAEVEEEDGYVIPGSNNRYLEEAEVMHLSKAECQLAINEIYARRGRIFDTKEYKEYFESMSWYQGTIRPENFDEQIFNKYESTNLQLLVKVKNNLSDGALDLTESLGCVR